MDSDIYVHRCGADSAHKGLGAMEVQLYEVG
jgi:hypothetical protein